MNISHAEKEQKKALSQQLFEQYLQAHLVDRDLDSIVDLIDPDCVSSFGTSRDEKIWNRKDFIKYYRRDVESVTEPIAYKIKEHHIHLPSGEFSIVQTVLDVFPVIEGYEVKLFDVRQTLIIDLSNSKPLICHVHTSFPTSINEDDEPFPLKEIQTISEVVNKLVSEKTVDIKDAYHQLEEAVVKDHLTGLYNRNKFDDVLLQEIKRSNRYSSIFSLIICDLDHFKIVNDLHGHLIGDQVLQSIADIISCTVRETDTSYRWGGEEFTIILPETGNEKAFGIAERIKEKIAGTEFVKSLTVTASFGITEFIQGDKIDTIFNRADQALYRAKREGRNRIVAE